ncbi:hypothetical protein Pla52o_55270 [Novipirellula galeiformis]|uniref:Uncharacterized protein n=2 Tax=Novipirellula galeiformis TaxID=2528004 RepID=A0A5C6BRW5_9BACT|nr:hypothetical protein Pla52o_55270 [Novipirellula galeiformis]
MTFKLGPAQDAENRIKRDFSEFSRLWSEVREVWLDDRCRQFEQQHLSNLGPSLTRFSSALQECCEVIRRAEEALNDDRARSDRLE